MLIKMLAPYWTIYQDELPNSDGAGGGGAVADLTVDIDAASDQIGAELGLGDDKDDKDLDKGERTDAADGSASSPPAKAPAASPDPKAEEAKLASEKAGKVAAARAKLAADKVDLTGKTDDEVLALAAPQVPAAPKSWKKEMHEHFVKLPPEVQAYVQQREAQVEEGFKVNAAKVQYADSMSGALAPYEPLLQAQGVKDPVFALKTLMNAHYILSTEQPAGRARFMAGMLKNYGVDLAQLTEEAQKLQPAADETPAMRELRERTERLERQNSERVTAQVEAVKAQTQAEVEAFASDPKHPYFNEVAREVVLLLQDPNVSLEQAYEQAVWANPVTRDKEQARIKEETRLAARKEAEEAAKAAEKARGTRIREAGEERASPDLVGTMEDTMRETLRGIKSRQD